MDNFQCLHSPYKSIYFSLFNWNHFHLHLVLLRIVNNSSICSLDFSLKVKQNCFSYVHHFYKRSKYKETKIYRLDVRLNFIFFLLVCAFIYVWWLFILSALSWILTLSFGRCLSNSRCHTKHASNCRLSVIW